MNVCLVRGKYLNNFEGQNYLFKNIRLTAISSLYPLDNRFPFKVIKLPSLADIPGRAVKYFANRTLGDSQILFGLEKFAPGFEICHTADPHYYYSYQLANLRKRKLIKNLVVTSWETIPFNNESTGRKKRIKYLVLDSADKFICYTDKAKETLIQEGVNGNKIKVIKLGVNLSDFRQKNNSAVNNPNKGITILFAGRLVEEKGVLELYEMFKSFKNKNLKLKLIGNGPLGNKILMAAEKDGLSELISCEQKNYREMPEVYRGADIFILPSRRSASWEEQYGMVLIEAMASGLPVVASRSGAISEVTGPAGVLVKEDNQRALNSAVDRLIKSEDLRRKLGKMGRERAEKYFDAKKTALKIEEIYLNINNK